MPSDSEFERTCACGQRHIVFESSRDTGGMAVATEISTFYCVACNEMLFQRTVSDVQSVMVLADDNPTVEALRRDRRANRRRRWLPWVLLVRLWQRLELTPFNVLSVAVALGALLWTFWILFRHKH